MNLLEHALQGARHTSPPADRASLLPLQRQTRLLVVGAGGTLGSAILAEALVAGRFARVQALVNGPLLSTLRGFEGLHESVLLGPDWLDAESAVLVFERVRHSNGRDEAYVQPAPQDLLAVAQRLHACGVQQLIVVLPHSPALLPQALRHGLATLDEGAVAALGFENLVFVRAAQFGTTAPGGPLLQRLANAWLAQLKLMVPSAEQPLRAVVLARCVVQLARQLPHAPAGTRVLAPETLAAAATDPLRLEAGLHRWLHGHPPP